MTRRQEPDDQPKTVPGSKTKTIALFGSSSPRPDSEPYRFALALGRGLAHAGFELVNGGYAGTMEAASKGAQDAEGTTIGVTLPGAVWASTPNGYLDEVIPAPDLLTRIDTMIRMSGGYIVLDGGTGTLAELGLVWEYVSKGVLPPRPIVLAGRCWDGLADEMAALRSTSVKCVYRADDVTKVVDILVEHAVGGTRARLMKKSPQDVTDDTATVSRLMAIMNAFVEDREWQPFHDPKNLSASIAIEAAELMEHFQWLRTDQLADVRNDPERMQAIGEEIADVFAYVLSFASTMGIDLASTFAEKMKKNGIKYPAAEFRGRFG